MTRYNKHTMILILGSREEAHACHIESALKARGQDCLLLDTRGFPTQWQLNLTPHTPQKPGVLVHESGTVVPLESVRAVYWRYHHGIETPDSIPLELQAMAYREIESAVGSLMRNLPKARWVNDVTAVERHRYKGHQLQLMALKGIPIPDTLVSNDPKAVLDFYHAHHGNVIFKPVSGGAHTSAAKPEDMTPERLQELAKCPVQFQEMIEGVDIRVYVIGDTVFAAEIQAETLDFRDDANAPIVPITLPEQVAQMCREICSLMGYQFTGIDLRRTPDGHFVAIEANPSPMFMYFEEQSGFPITKTLCDLLLA